MDGLNLKLEGTANHKDDVGVLLCKGMKCNLYFFSMLMFYINFRSQVPIFC